MTKTERTWFEDALIFANPTCTEGADPAAVLDMIRTAALCSIALSLDKIAERDSREAILAKKQMDALRPFERDDGK